MDPDRGTRFDIHRPTIKRATETAPQQAVLPTGRERIRVVDDEAVIVDIGRQHLAHLGYRVEDGPRSEEALDRFRRNPGGCDLAITDMAMPRMTGDRLAEEFFKLRPGFPIILCAGYSSRIDSRLAKSIGIWALLMKPLNLNELAHSIRQVLDETAGGDSV